MYVYMYACMYVCAYVCACVWIVCVHLPINSVEIFGFKVGFVELRDQSFGKNFWKKLFRQIFISRTLHPLNLKKSPFSSSSANNETFLEICMHYREKQSCKSVFKNRICNCIYVETYLYGCTMYFRIYLDFIHNLNIRTLSLSYLKHKSMIASQLNIYNFWQY